MYMFYILLIPSMWCGNTNDIAFDKQCCELKYKIDVVEICEKWNIPFNRLFYPIGNILYCDPSFFAVNLFVDNIGSKYVLMCKSYIVVALSVLLFSLPDFIC